MGSHDFFKGEGLDVSRERVLANATHAYKEPNNLYSLKDIADFESLDYIYSKKVINETKFHKILIKEWLNFVKVGGYVIVDMIPNSILNFEDLVEEINILSRRKARVVFKNEHSDYRRVVFKKIKKILVDEDTINKWSFGIITNGKNNAAVDEEIKSIEKLNIPTYEVLVCGEYKPGKKFRNLRIIPFDSTIPWTTRKKNLLCKAASYENLVITHDRFIFDEGWYEGMKKYGNFFEAIGCRITDLSGGRAVDWVTAGVETNPFFRNRGYLEYEDWDENVFLSGGFSILKKSVWNVCNWNDALLWGQGEDVELSNRYAKEGFVSRVNPFSVCVTTAGAERFQWPKFKFHKRRFISLKDRPLLSRLKIYLLILCRIYIIKPDPRYNHLGVRDVLKLI